MVAVAELAVSNICWPDGPEAQETAIETLAAHGVHAIDIAPSKAFPEMVQVGADGIDRDELVAFKRTLRFRNNGYEGPMRVAGFQAVTFGRSENIFSESAEDVAALQDHMEGVIRLAEFVGAQTIVYGSGGTRKTGNLDEEQIQERALEFFAPLGNLARESGVVLGIEPVSTTWTNGEPVFGRTGAEVVEFADKLRSEYGVEGVKFVPDSFAMHDGDDNAWELLLKAKMAGVLAPHAQIAEPGMAPHTHNGPIQASHFQLDCALKSWMADAAADRWHANAPMPTLAIEMFAQKVEGGAVAQGSELRLALGGVISAAFKSYDLTLGRIKV